MQLAAEARSEVKPEENKAKANEKTEKVKERRQRRKLNKSVRVKDQLADEQVEETAIKAIEPVESQVDRR